MVLENQLLPAGQDVNSFLHLGNDVDKLLIMLLVFFLISVLLLDHFSNVFISGWPVSIHVQSGQDSNTFTVDILSYIRAYLMVLFWEPSPTNPLEACNNPREAGRAEVISRIK